MTRPAEDRDSTEFAAPTRAIEELALAGDRRVDLAWALAAFGAFLFLPMTIVVFATPTTLFGLPTLWVYLFGGWLFLICAAALLSSGRGGDGRLERDARVADRSEP